LKLIFFKNCHLSVAYLVLRMLRKWAPTGIWLFS
jgi:hypothetical protein